MPFVIVIDGSNFINSLCRAKKDANYMLNILSLPKLQNLIQQRLNNGGLAGHPFLHTYFICSNKQKLGCLKGEFRDQFIEKLIHSTGVTVDIIEHGQTSEGKEEEVDMHVFIKMLEMGPLSHTRDAWRHIVLISSDKDFVPAIRILSNLGTHTVTVGMNDKNQYPQELINESFLFINLSELLDEMEQNPLPPELASKMK
jgi:hypothetical protein